MRKTENDPVTVYCLTKEEYADPVLMNQCIKESGKQYLAFVRGEEGALILSTSLYTWSERVLEQLLPGSSAVTVFCRKDFGRGISYEQTFLLDTDDISGILFDKGLVQKCGSFQIHLSCGSVWEYLCRLTKETGKCSVAVISAEVSDGGRELFGECADDIAFTHAYVVRSHMNELHRRGAMDSVFQQVCQKMRDKGCYEQFMRYMNQFLADPAQYERIASQTAPFLVLRGDDTCMGVLQKFADDLAEALVKEGQAVRVIGDDPNQYDELPGHIYKGIIGFQTKALEIDFFRNLTGPKFQFWMDYPLRFQNVLRDLPEEYYILCQDADHARQIRDFYHTPNAIQFPPGGIARQREEGERPYDIVFVGSFFPDEGEKLEGIQKAYYEFMLAHPERTFERGYLEMTDCSEEEIETEHLAERMLALKPAGRAVIGHFRNKVVKKILESGYSLHVYGEDWYNFGYEGSNLIVHPQVSVEESLRELQKAKIGLNIMSWHKSGMTERIANIMLSGAVCLSDETVFLREHMTDGDNILLFGLSELNKLPQMIASILKDDDKRQGIAQKAYAKAINEFTWDVRARELIKLSENTINNIL